MNHPAFKAIVKASEHFLEAYQNDLLVHDKNLIKEFPDAAFFWFLRSSGTHLIPLGNGPTDPQGKETFEALWGANSEHYFWDGTQLSPIRYEKAKALLEQNKPLKFQF